MHSHHSHSGDYVSHAQDHLDDVVALAANKGFTTFCLTEHMPRLSDRYLYPEEVDKGYTSENLSRNFSDYLDHAHTVQQNYKTHPLMQVLVGFEVEGIDDDHIDKAISILGTDPRINMSVGSVHYVNLIPIDFDQSEWIRARASTLENTTRALYISYFELQYKVIKRVHSEVIGHFDLIRLFQPQDELDPTTGKHIKDITLETDWPDVWALIVRNIKYAASYGALFELNSAALRKGWTCPYPQLDICSAIKEHGQARFCLSDDSHGLAHVGLNFHKTWDFVKTNLQLQDIFYLELEDGKVVVRSEKVLELDRSAFWQQYK